MLYLCKWCAEGLYIPNNGKMWINSISGNNFTTWGNKRSFFNEIADIINFDNVILQFKPVLPKEEKHFSAITLRGKARNTVIKYFSFDSLRKSKDKYYRPLISESNETWNKIKKGKFVRAKSKNLLIKMHK